MVTQKAMKKSAVLTRVLLLFTLPLCSLILMTWHHFSKDLRTSHNAVVKEYSAFNSAGTQNGVDNASNGVQSEVKIVEIVGAFSGGIPHTTIKLETIDSKTQTQTKTKTTIQFNTGTSTDTRKENVDTEKYKLSHRVTDSLDEKSSPMANDPIGKKESDLVKRPLLLLSKNKSVTSDVRGNLGPPSVITSESTEDWLKDRWQGTISS